MSVLQFSPDMGINLPKAGLVFKPVRLYAGNQDERRICPDEWS
jgi:hypothetical protein